MSQLSPAAVKEKNDEEIAKLEAEIESQLASQQEEGLPDSETPSEEDKPDSESVPEEENIVEEESPEIEDSDTIEDDGEELKDEEVKRLSAKAQRRFRKLTEELNEKERLLEAREKYEPKPKPEEIQPQRLPWDLDEGNGNQQVDLQEEIEKRSREIVKEELHNKEIIQNLQSDIKSVQDKYPELNPEDTDYDPVLVTKISSWYKAQFVQNPDLRLSDFTEEIMSLKTAGKEQGKAEITGKVMKQAAEQALTPSTVKTEGRSAVDAIRKASSIEELEELEGLLS